MAMQEAFKHDGKNAELREENTCDGFSQSKTPAFVVQETQITSAEGSEDVFKKEPITMEKLTETNGAKRKKKKKRKKNTNLAFAAATEQGNTNEMTPPVEEANLDESPSSTSETPPVYGCEDSCKQPSGSSCGKKKKKNKKKKTTKDVTTLSDIGGDDYDSTVREIAANDVDPVNEVTSGDNVVEEQRDNHMKRNPYPQNDVIQEDGGDLQETTTKTVVDEDFEKEVDNAVESDNNCDCKSEEVVELVTAGEDFLVSDKTAKSYSSQATEVVSAVNVNLDTPACDGLEETGDRDEIEEVKLSDAEDNSNVDIDKGGAFTMATQEAFKNNGKNAELREENTCDEFSQSKTPAFVEQETPITSSEGSEDVSKEESIPVEKLTETNGAKRKKKKKRKKNTNIALTAATEQGNANEMTPSVEETNLDENPSSTRETRPVDGHESSCKQSSGSSSGKKKNKKKKKKKTKDVTTLGAVGDVIQEDGGDLQETTTKTVVDKDFEKEVDNAVESDNNCDCTSEEVVELVTAGDADAEDNSNVEMDKEGRNILCILKLVYGVGLRTLRKLFKGIHPSWSNQPSDAAGFSKGKMNVCKEAQAIFNTGNIEEWDFSLMTTVLLYSPTCSVAINKRPGYEVALRELKECRNKLLGHPSSDKMSDGAFNYFWPLLSANFVTLGADSREINDIKRKSDEIYATSECYKQLFLAEQERNKHEFESIHKKLDDILANQRASGASSVEPLEERSGPQWDEWQTFREGIDAFDTQKNQYILVTDTVPKENLESYSLLKSVSWKMILDFDPLSEVEGFYREFTSREGQRNLLSMFTPAELNQSTMKSLFRQIDPNKTQWVFVKGRSGDNYVESKEFLAWETSAVKGISSLFRCCSDPETFDQLKPVICVILPFRSENIPFLEVTLSRLTENFNNLNLKFVSVDNKNWPSEISEKFDVREFGLSPKILSLGFKDLLDTTSDKKLRMPTSQGGLPVYLSARQYLYIKEHLEILYAGCENLQDDPTEAEEQQHDYLEQQRKSFLSGNEISFASLFDNHDATRDIEREIQIHVQRLLDRDQGLTKPLIVEIRHSPGSGGTTIARRVLWDLHKAYPCALINVSSYRYSEDDKAFPNEVAERIIALEEICNTAPLILIDGKQAGAIEGLCNKLCRILQNRGKRALLLQCLRGLKADSKRNAESCLVHKVFTVNVKLQESVSDLREFKSKYKEYIDTIDESMGKKSAMSDACRVFHFPLLAMLEEFRPKLETIIEDTFNELGGIQQEIAKIVAFLQKYTSLPTPALLLYEIFKEYIRVQETNKGATYSDIKELFSEFLMNLMIPAKPRRLEKESLPESYTFQHPLVADLILKRVYHLQKLDLFAIVENFIQFPIYQKEPLLPLLFELFVYNKQGETERLKFSILFEELKGIDSDRAAEIFCKAAENLNDSVMFGNAARFCARKEPPSFPKAKELIQRALEVHGSDTKPGYKNLCHTKGVVLHFEMIHLINSGEVANLVCLEDVASKVLEAHREARNFPPTYPHPLIGEVEVWLECLKWIMDKECGGDTEKTLEFVINKSPPFFRSCINDSFYLLDIVDGIVQSVSHLADPSETKRLCDELRLSLMTMVRKQYAPTGRRKPVEDIVEACKAICTTKHFRESSQLELKRLQAHFILRSKSIDGLNKQNLMYLLKLLEELVLKEHEYRLAQHLMKVCILVTGPRCYSLKQGLHVCEKWLVAGRHNCLPDFYQMAICFLQILDGNSLEYMPKYIQALGKCREKSQNHLRRFYATHFIAKDGKGMTRLISRHALFHGETEFTPDNLDRFWQVDVRKKLLECKGRIRVKPSSGREKSHLYIELVQGNLELYVGKNADIGKVQRDFTPGTLVYFVVSFNLEGPVANGITFSPHDPSLETKGDTGFQL
ncbi:sterile alpha motif domain-containing protein 9-like [Montipora capricornis]|uniref:sterile alpha motif domain-containing protein 9-like n=1 Tax=Montipora capricornis TaxID=246305 RepID=UPI0035F1C310